MLNSSFSQKLRYNDNFPGSRFSTHKKTPLVQTATVQRELKEGKKNQTKKILRRKIMAVHSGSSILKRMMRRREKKPRDKFPHRSRRDSGPSSSDDDEEDDTSDNPNAKGERNTVSMVYTTQKYIRKSTLQQTKYV